MQVQRTLHPARFGEGERSIFEQYRLAIAAARRSIYIENQALEVAEIVDDLRAALARDVEVVLLMPAEPEAYPAPDTAERRAFVSARAALGRYPNFTLAGIAGLGATGQRQNVYVHAKLMLVDDAWATIGSGNLHGYSLFGSTEMNASIWDAAFTRALRCELLAEHLQQDTSPLADDAALRLFHRISHDNRERRDAGDARWQGLAFEMDAATWHG
jgi:phosphatidylserine/phosphatidylglycerophosphate/cardiolipin synthase-like enzyme